VLALKIRTAQKCGEIDGCVNDEIIAGNFAKYFSPIYISNSAQRASSLYNEFLQAKENYFGSPLTDDWLFDTELVSKIIAELKRGRAADIDGLTAEHLTHANPVLSVVLSKLFRIIQLCK